ncbi:probable ATP-dependent RNA helicase DHX58 isoform X3 [Nomascus leucogenys]|uniref:probable ATP-dependent RNA helicase DHX58 isoform X3 n=1 Tax=Nomascus leucogenys TaxID=61853 RepID=UPI00122DB742|nr:probable ATP-dependent RNA helicase DHX58 isoform X3 [Nomascus leucogenys]
MELRPYQREVIMPALEGKNIIIWLPTGAGKTRAAAYVAKRHLETVDGAKVVVLVNRVHLVTQHGEEFRRMLDGRWTMTTLSGDMGPRAGFGHLARCHDLLICTAELLQMALTSPEEEEHVELTAFSLIVVDECHHTHKDTVYNVIMSQYLELKFQRAQPLPQVLGLTASPGTGGASKLNGAINHILQLCANLDTWCIMSPQNYCPQLQEHSQQPCKQYNLCHRRSQDPFGDLLKKLMDQIHDHLEMPELSRNFGTQMYEQQVVKLSEAGERGSPSGGVEDVGVVRGGACRGRDLWGGACLGGGLRGGAYPLQGRSRVERPYGAGQGAGLWAAQTLRPLPSAALAGLQEQRVYALHLRRYNDALLIHDTVRAVDALAALQDFYHREHVTKTQILCAERRLLALFDDHKNVLAHLATHGPENPKLEMLEKILQRQFRSSDSPRGIIFTRTRQSTHSLLLWLQQQPGLKTLDIRAQLLIGAGNSSQSTHMTQRDQQEVIWKFRNGTLNLLVATSVAEEGLDIPHCNVVVRYGLLTNEISMVQQLRVAGS